MHTVAVAAFDGVVPFDLALPCEVFGRVQLPKGAGYDVRVCATRREARTDHFVLRARHGLAWLAKADTIIVPGITHDNVPIDPALVRVLQRAAESGKRIASICSGAFVLAAAGLLDGKRATTHWLAAAELARRHPAVTVDPNVLYVDNGQISTSAGAAAGFDLCLHLVRRDYGAAVAAEAARLSVMPLERDGGQAQFIVHPPPGDDGSLAPLLHWLDERLGESLELSRMARRAGLSVRTLNRRFREQLGTTPLQWLLQARIRRARVLLETTAQPVERVAERVGFGSIAAFRAQFVRLTGTNAQAYRRAFRSQGKPAVTRAA
jgi:transcriptional regulator GlxA family with amidase domain